MIVNAKSNGDMECMVGLSELRGVVKGLPPTGDLIEARSISMPDGLVGLLLSFRPAVTITQTAVDVVTGTSVVQTKS